MGERKIVHIDFGNYYIVEQDSEHMEKVWGGLDGN